MTTSVSAKEPGLIPPGWWRLGRAPISPAGLDVVLYSLAALFSLGAALRSSIPLYREWGQIAVGPYLLAAGLAAIITIRGRRRPVVGLRTVLAGLVVVGTVLVPLAFEITWRFDISPQALHVQPEVVVVERAATLIVHGHDPYQAVVVDGHLHGRVAGLPAYEAFFPYLPAMAIFGAPAALGVPRQLGDARLWFTFSTLLAVALALWWAPASADRRLRALQVAVVLPWATLTMATGGDDLPIVGLLIASMVLAQRRRPGWAGVVLGVASAMKFTAWPLAALALFAAFDREGRRRPLRMLAGMMAVVAPVALAGFLAGPRRFVANVVLFPLGLSGVASPAGSALPGHIIVSAVPSIHRIFPVVCALVGVVVLVLYLRRRPPHDAAEVCKVAGWVLLVAILLAPATRIGYLIYPLNFFVWSWMLTAPEPPSGLLPSVDQAPSEAW